MTVAAKVRKDHQFTSTSGPDIRHSGCTCGAITRWETRYADHADHVDEEIETALRQQIATEIRLGINEYSGQLIEQAARIAEEGAFHCCAHPKCPGGSICCCPDAEEGNTK